jgi:hypothetical protein
MPVDVFFKKLMVEENGSSSKHSTALVVMKWCPDGTVSRHEGLHDVSGRKINKLKDGTPYNPGIDAQNDGQRYQKELEMRVNPTGPSWLEVQIVAYYENWFTKAMGTAILAYAQSNWPLPVGKELLDVVGAGLKSGFPQVIAEGNSDTFMPKDFATLGKIDISLSVPEGQDILGSVDPFGFESDDDTLLTRRQLLLERGSPNGTLTVSILETPSLA